MEKASGFRPELVAHFANMEMYRRGPEEFFAESHTKIDDWNVYGPTGLVDQLRDRLVQLQRPCGNEAQQRGSAENREHRDGATNRQGERDFFRCDALGELRDERITEAALPESTSRGGRNLSRIDGHRRIGVEDPASDAKPRTTVSRRLASQRWSGS